MTVLLKKPYFLKTNILINKTTCCGRVFGAKSSLETHWQPSIKVAHSFQKTTKATVSFKGQWVLRASLRVGFHKKNVKTVYIEAELFFLNTSD